MLTVTLYTRKNCHLCEQVKEDLASLQNQFPHQLVELDIDTDGSLQEKYGNTVPVVEVGPYRRTAPITRQDLGISLGAAIDRMTQLEKLNDPIHEARKKNSRLQEITRADRFSFWFSGNYIWVLNLAIFIYLGLPFLAPVLMKAGAAMPATLIYRGYGFVCHQLAYRSWFLFGNQPAYPRELAGVDGLVPFGEATGLGESNSNNEMFAARNFVGNEQLGYKVGFCERDVGIYAGLLLFGIVFALTGRRIPLLNWFLWILIGMGPIGLDGFSQLLSQPPLNNFFLFSWLPLRESTPFLRSLTGAIFGFTTGWLGYPLVEETMQDTRRALLVKFERLKQ
ncbi:MAG TPA: glutaredoxin family protein [Anaerolineales bacterium]|nr:glutaredoxin family protein [Anaerolineales bacterium]